MNEVEKMYENANVEKQGACPYNCTTVPYHNCEVCKYKDDIHWFYPPFTAEKQLELIKWLSKFDLRIEQPDYAKNNYFIETHIRVFSKFMPIFEEALAGIINTLWESILEEERKQIKEILE